MRNHRNGFLRNAQEYVPVASGGQNPLTCKEQLVTNLASVHDVYDLGRMISAGSYGEVCRATKKGQLTSQMYAIKSLTKGKLMCIERLTQEITMMKVIGGWPDHPNIIKVLDTFEDTSNFYMVMELCSGGSLLERVIDAGQFTEVHVARLMQQIFRALYYIHTNQVCHRNVIPDNFVCWTKQPLDKSVLKLIDFGLSCKFEKDQVLTTQVGTPYYVAPQVLAGKYTFIADLWSCGVIMYLLFCGYPPFYGHSDAEVLSRVRLGNFSFNIQEWKNVSEDAKNLIRMCLKMNPRDRYTAEQALNHVWVKNKAPGAANAPLVPNCRINLRGLDGLNKFKKVAMYRIARELSELQIKELRNTFKSLDSNGDGLLTIDQMRQALTKIGFELQMSDMVISCKHVGHEGYAVGSIVCTTLGGDHVGSFEVPPKESPFGQWLVFEILKCIQTAMADRVLLVDEAGEVILTHDSEMSLAKTLSDLDFDSSGRWSCTVLDYTEFVDLTLKKKDSIQEAVVWGVFNKFDKRDDGKISKVDAQKVLCDIRVNDVVGQDAIDAYTNELVGTWSDREITFVEFMATLRQHRLRLDAF